jgi:haloacetate dehalogenase
MHQFGHDRFAVVGHDRGSYVAMRLALHAPETVTALAVLDSVPIGEALTRATATFAQAWWHWFFFAQPEKPERAILADPDAWYGANPDRMGQENYAVSSRIVPVPDIPDSGRTPPPALSTARGPCHPPAW